MTGWAMPTCATASSASCKKPHSRAKTKGNEMLNDTLRSDLENLRAEIDVGWQSLANENTRFDIGGCLLTAMYRIASRNPEDCARRHAMTRALGFTHRDGSAAYCATFRWNDAQRDPGMIKRWIKEALR